MRSTRCAAERQSLHIRKDEWISGISGGETPETAGQKAAKAAVSAQDREFHACQAPAGFLLSESFSQQD
jgi:hypothetical protein